MGMYIPYSKSIALEMFDSLVLIQKYRGADFQACWQFHASMRFVSYVLSSYLNCFCIVLLSDHKRDAARAEDALTLSYGSELIGMQRDWNEELQSCREFPHTNPQERYI